MPQATAKPAATGHSHKASPSSSVAASASPTATAKPAASPTAKRKPSRRLRGKVDGTWRGWLFLGLVLVTVLLALGVLEWRFLILRERQREEKLLLGIHIAAACHGLDPELVRAVVWKESRFNPQSIGTKGEIGLMQITEGAVHDWARLNHQPIPNQNELFAPERNLMIGCWYLAHCRKHWDGYASQDILQLAEYNAGRTKVLKDWAPEKPEETITIESITYPSTRNYIKEILERRRRYRKERASAY